MSRIQEETVKTEKRFKKHSCLSAGLLCLTLLFALVISGRPALAETETGQQAYVPTDAFAYTVGEPAIRDRSATEKQINFYRDGIKIWGKLCLPEGDGPFPLVIMSSGFRARGTYNEKWAKQLAAEGYAAAIFDFTGSSPAASNGGSLTDLSVLSEAADLNAVMDSLIAMPCIDKDNVFLFGHSFGGFVSAYVGCKRSGEIRGMLLLEPSFQLRDSVMADYPELAAIPDIVYTPDFLGKIFFIDLYSFDIYDLMPGFEKDVLLFAATDPESVGGAYPEYYVRAAETFPAVRTVSVEGADHQFQGTAGEEMMANVLAYLAEHTGTAR